MFLIQPPACGTRLMISSAGRGEHRFVMSGAAHNWNDDTVLQIHSYLRNILLLLYKFHYVWRAVDIFLSQSALSKIPHRHIFWHQRKLRLSLERYLSLIRLLRPFCWKSCVSFLGSIPPDWWDISSIGLLHITRSASNLNVSQQSTGLNCSIYTV